MTKRSIQLDSSLQADDLRTAQTVVRIPLWLSIVVICGAILLTAGAVISKVDPSLLVNGEQITAATRVYADYTFARDVPLAVGLLLLLAIHARRTLAGLMVLIGLMQFLDTLNDLARADFMIVPIVLVFAIVFLAGAWQLFGQAPWHIDAWREPKHHSLEPR